MVQALVGAQVRHLNCPGCPGLHVPWRGLDPVEFTMFEQIDRFNNRRLLEPIRNRPPAEAKAAYYRQPQHTALAA